MSPRVLLLSALIALPLPAAGIAPEDVATDLAERWLSAFNVIDREQNRIELVLARGNTTFKLDDVQSLRRDGRLLIVEYGGGGLATPLNAVINAADVLVIRELPGG